MKHIIFTVTNDLSYDQRMQRICTSLSTNGFRVTLVGRKLRNSIPLRDTSYAQKRLRCFFTKGKLFYAEYNTRLFFYLLGKKADALCAIDLDTILPCLYVSKWKKLKRIHDAHELFTGLKEVEIRPKVKKFWMAIEKRCIPQFPLGYTVSAGIAEEFRRRYEVSYPVIRNMTRLRPLDQAPPNERFILYQGWVNEARAFESLVPAMKLVNCRLVVCGDGNFMPQLKELIRKNELADKVELRGMLPPEELWQLSQRAFIGVAVAENTGLNQFLALPNKFFDYMHAGLPQVTMNFPEYKRINEEFEVAVLIDNVLPETIAGALNNLLSNAVLYDRLKENCMAARQVYNWQNEEKKLIEFYQSVF